MIKYSIRDGDHCFFAHDKIATIFACELKSKPKAWINGSDINLLIKICDFKEFDLEKCKKLFFSTNDIEVKFEKLKNCISTDFKNSNCEIYYYLR